MSEEGKFDPAKYSFSSLDRREPVISDAPESKPNISLINQQWNMATEVIRQNILENAEVRATLASFATHPVDQRLAKKALEAIANKDPRLNSLFERSQPILGKYLDLPEVPLELIIIDLKNTPRLQTPEEIAELYEQGYSTSDNLAEDLERMSGAGRFKTGISGQERELLLNRLRYARDIKLLSFGAEAQNNLDLKLDESGQATLPSGIKIGVSPKTPNAAHDLMNAAMWEKRREIKDRVYEIAVGGNSYILKEQKTRLHKDTKKGGHQPTMSSKGEFNIARHFETEGKRSQKTLELNWEKPVGFINFPDGYQCSVFEFESGLIGNSSQASNEMAKAINQRRQDSETEYRELSLRAKKFVDDERVVRYKPFGETSTSIAELTFEEFARVKGFRLAQEGRRLQARTITELGYRNDDFDGCAYRILNDPSKPLKLEVLGFDFEYLQPIPQDYIKATINQNKKFDSKWDERGISIGGWGKNGEPRVTPAEAAAYLALLENESDSL